MKVCASGRGPLLLANSDQPPVCMLYCCSWKGKEAVRASRFTRPSLHLYWGDDEQPRHPNDPKGAFLCAQNVVRAGINYKFW